MGTRCGNGRQHSAPGFDLDLVRDATADPTPILRSPLMGYYRAADRSGAATIGIRRTRMNDRLQILLDSGAVYLAAAVPI